MANLLLYYAHPGHRHSRVNKSMAKVAQKINGITFVDLYSDYPRHNINVEREQQRLLDHDVVMFQFPLFWYSTPSLIKEWQDLVLEHGFAYGSGGDNLTGKTMMLALTAAGSEEAYTTNGYQHFPLRTFLTPLEQTARLCKMSFAAPYVLHSSLQVSEPDEIAAHVEGYERLLKAIRDDRYSFDGASQRERVTYADIPLNEEA